MRSRSSKEYLIGEPAGTKAGEENLGLRRELDRLDVRLADDAAWRALLQLDEREGRGEPLQAIAGDTLRAALQSRLSSNKFYLARVKIAAALAILQGDLADAEWVPESAAPAGTAESATAAAAPGPIFPPANTFRTNLKIKPKASMSDAASGTETAAAAAAAAATSDVASPPVAADPSEKDDGTQDNGPSAVSRPAASAGDAVSSAAAAAEDDARSTARLRQIAAWRHADVLRARGAELTGNDGGPASMVPDAELAAQSPALPQHEPRASSSTSQPQLHWIKGIDGDLARQLVAMGAGDPSISTAGDPSVRAAGDPSVRAAGDPSVRAAGDPSVSAAGDPSVDCASDEEAAAVSAAQAVVTQMSRWSAADVARISSNLQLGNRPSVENWIEQAAYLASGRPTRYATRVVAGETAAVVPAPEQVAASVRKPKALRKPVFSIPAATAQFVLQEPCPAPSADGISATPSGYTGDFLSGAYRTPAVQPQSIPPVFEDPPRAEMVSAFDLPESAPPPAAAANREQDPESAEQAARASAFVPARRVDHATAPQFPSDGQGPVKASMDADPFGNIKNRLASAYAAAETLGSAGLDEEAAVVILARDNGTQAGDATAAGSGQNDGAKPMVSAHVAAPPARRENRIESHAAYHSQTDEASVVIVSRDKGDEAPDLAFYKQNEQWQREGTIRKFLKALTGD